MDGAGVRGLAAGLDGDAPDRSEGALLALPTRGSGGIHSFPTLMLFVVVVAQLSNPRL